ncbi:MAG: tetratricopeptide repeat protein [bacterium]|nr:tetratricopeptide repeat protein [bacterium]
MKKINLIMALFIGAAVFSGCKLSKMIKLANDQDLTVEPNPLEVHGGKIAFEMSAVLPPKMLPSGTAYTLKTIYQYGDQEINLPGVEFKADDFPSSSTSTSRKSQDFTFDYQDGMNPGKLMIGGEAKDTRSGKTAETPAKLQVATGLITTSMLVKDVYYAAYADHGYNDKEELIPTNVDFFFDQGRSVLKTSEKRSDRGSNFSAFVAEKNVTKTVTITGLHSPEGTERINSGLAEERAAAIEKYYRQQMKKYDYKDLSDSIKFILKPVIEDWQAFKDALKDYDGIDGNAKSEVLRIVNGTGTFEDKEKSLQKLDSYKKLFKDLYPSLRTAKTEILTVKPKKANAEIAVLAKSVADGNAKADTLSAEELLFAGNMTPSLDEKVAIYTAATKANPSWQAHNNLAAALLMQAKAGDADKVDAAITQLEIAAKLQKTAEVHTNLATAYAMQANYDKAMENVEAAEGLGGSAMLKAGLNSVKGAILVRQGDYSAATSALSAPTKDLDAMFDKGLALLLNKDFAQAEAAFNEVTSAEDGYALAWYAGAIASARQGNASDVKTKLIKATNLDASLKEKALADLEFRTFAAELATALK